MEIPPTDRNEQFLLFDVFSIFRCYSPPPLGPPHFQTVTAILLTWILTILETQPFLLINTSGISSKEALKLYFMSYYLGFYVSMKEIHG